MEDAILENSKGATYMSFVLDIEIVIKKEGRINLAESKAKSQVPNKGEKRDQHKNKDVKVYAASLQPHTLTSIYDFPINPHQSSVEPGKKTQTSKKEETRNIIDLPKSIEQENNDNYYIKNTSNQHKYTHIKGKDINHIYKNEELSPNNFNHRNSRKAIKKEGSKTELKNENILEDHGGVVQKEIYSNYNSNERKNLSTKEINMNKADVSKKDPIKKYLKNENVSEPPKGIVHKEKDANYSSNKGNNLVIKENTVKNEKEFRKDDNKQYLKSENVSKTPEGIIHKEKDTHYGHKKRNFLPIKESTVANKEILRREDNKLYVQNVNTSGLPEGIILKEQNTEHSSNKATHPPIKENTLEVKKTSRQNDEKTYFKKDNIKNQPGEIIYKENDIESTSEKGQSIFDKDKMPIYKEHSEHPRDEKDFTKPNPPNNTNPIESITRPKRKKRIIVEKKPKVFKGKFEPIDFLECNRIFMCNFLKPIYNKQTKIESDSSKQLSNPVVKKAQSKIEISTSRPLRNQNLFSHKFIPRKLSSYWQQRSSELGQITEVDPEFKTSHSSGDYFTNERYRIKSYELHKSLKKKSLQNREPMKNKTNLIGNVHFRNKYKYYGKKKLGKEMSRKSQSVPVIQNKCTSSPSKEHQDQVFSLTTEKRKRGLSSLKIIFFNERNKSEPEINKTEILEENQVSKNDICSLKKQNLTVNPTNHADLELEYLSTIKTDFANETHPDNLHQANVKSRSSFKTHNLGNFNCNNHDEGNISNIKKQTNEPFVISPSTSLEFFSDTIPIPVPTFSTDKIQDKETVEDSLCFSKERETSKTNLKGKRGKILHPKTFILKKLQKYKVKWNKSK